MKYYHATPKTNSTSILSDWCIHKGFDGVVYLADSIENAVKFVILRCLDEPISILEIDGLDESKISESFDHSEAFFQCKAYYYSDDISLDNVTNMYVYQYTNEDESEVQ